MVSPPTAVLFDLDGTLIDSIDLILHSAKYAFDACGMSCPPDEDWLAGVGTPLPTMFARWADTEAGVDALIAAYREHQLANHDSLVRSYDAVAETLELLSTRGHPMAVVTSKREELAVRGLELVGIGHHFRTIVGFDACTRHKPDPEPVLIALDRLGYRPEAAVFVGDSVHDVASGNAAGVRTVAALWGPFTREILEPSEPTHIIESIRELPALLGQGE